MSEHRRERKRAARRGISNFINIILIIAISLMGGIFIGTTVDIFASPNLGGDTNDNAGDPGTMGSDDVPGDSGDGADGVASHRVHPAFTLDSTELTELVNTALVEIQAESGMWSGDRTAIQEAVAARPQVFLDLVANMLETEDQMLFVSVDKKNFLATDYAESDIVSLNSYDDILTLNRGDLRLRESILPYLFAMVEAAAQQGITLDISSSYRSYLYQEGLFQRNVDQMGVEAAERESARPGTSQHQLGTTIDFGSVTAAYARHPGGIWLSEHAWEYGFTISFPDGYEPITGYIYEPWHYRYIGRDAARLQQEFFAGIQQYLILFYKYAADDLRAVYRPQS